MALGVWALRIRTSRRRRHTRARALSFCFKRLQVRVWRSWVAAVVAARARAAEARCEVWRTLGAAFQRWADAKAKSASVGAAVARRATYLACQRGLDALKRGVVRAASLRLATVAAARAARRHGCRECAVALWQLQLDAARAARRRAVAAEAARDQRTELLTQARAANGAAAAEREALQVRLDEVSAEADRAFEAAAEARQEAKRVPPCPTAPSPMPPPLPSPAGQVAHDIAEARAEAQRATAELAGMHDERGQWGREVVQLKEAVGEMRRARKVEVRRLLSPSRPASRRNVA